MSLRRQLLLVSLLVLVLPWAGYEYLRETERALRDAQQQAVLATARALAVVAARAPAGAAGTHGVLYAHRLPAALTLDGYASDWGELAGALEPASHHGDRLHRGSPASGIAPLSLVAGLGEDGLYLLAQMRDANIVYFNPARERANGDRVILRLGRGGEQRYYVLMSSAPGELLARTLEGQALDRPGADVPGLRAAWATTADGFRLEVRVPADLLGDALALFWIDSTPGSAPVWWGTSAAITGAPGRRLVRAQASLEQALGGFVGAGMRVRVTDDEGWLLADLDRLHETRAQTPRTVGGLASAMLQRLVRFVLERGEARGPPLERSPGRLRGALLGRAQRGEAAVDWYRDGRFAGSVVLAAVPLGGSGGPSGVLVTEQSSDAVAAVTGLALTRLVLLTLLALVVVALGLLGYASLLSWRVRRLRDAVRRSIDDDGTVHADFARSRSHDEIGELSRSYGDLLVRVREYTQYLRKLAGSLAHELRTPLAVVSSSLEHLQEAPLQKPERTYLERAQHGAARLRAILSAMSEASRVEQALESGERQRFDLAALLGECVPAYRDVYPERRIELQLPDARPCPIDGVPELIVQLLDKLIDNAVDFSPPAGRVRVYLVQDRDGVRLGVANEGPHLPQTMQAELFEPMVSLREARDETPHLGLGLYIVRLIANLHGARVSARNTDAPQGVVVELHWRGRAA